MPEGPWQADAPQVVLPDREKMKTQMEALIYHFKIVTEGFRVPAGEVYQVIESPRGEIGLLRRQRRHRQAVPRVHAHAELRQSAGAAADGRRQADRRHDRLDGQHGFRAGRRGPLHDFLAATRTANSQADAAAIRRAGSGRR